MPIALYLSASLLFLIYRCSSIFSPLSLLKCSSLCHSFFLSFFFSLLLFQYIFPLPFFCFSLCRSSFLFVPLLPFTIVPLFFYLCSSSSSYSLPFTILNSSLPFQLLFYLVIFFYHILILFHCAVLNHFSSASSHPLPFYSCFHYPSAIFPAFFICLILPSSPPPSSPQLIHFSSSFALHPA